MTRTASSQALARATASVAGIGAAADFADLGGFTARSQVERRLLGQDGAGREKGGHDAKR